ncbi:MAG: phosphoribosylformylglycinamidine synthase I, partial [Firmicutes bacterium]|nr:phosphoribosylformylglycinamidine synthase I [Bacillota bacterium]
MKFGVVVFPGSNCDADCLHAIQTVTGQPAEYIWHKTGSVDGFDCIVLPGGFSYGDYLRCGAIAIFSPVMQPIIEFARRGGLVIGICNGFQVLVRTGILPHRRIGEISTALVPNDSGRFECRWVNLLTEKTRCIFTEGLEGKCLSFQVAHAEGKFYADQEILKNIKGQVVFRYVDQDGNPLPGVSVTISSAYYPERTVVTSESGLFRFPRLPVARDYKIKFELQGFKTVVRENIIVEFGKDYRLDITMEMAPISEEITVTAVTPVIDTKKAQVGLRVSKEMLMDLPTARNPWVIMQLAPGVLVDREDVGGNEAGQQSAYYGHG